MAISRLMPIRWICSRSILSFSSVTRNQLKKVLPAGGKTSHPGFYGIGENAKGVGQKELGNILLVIGQVVVKGGFQFNVGIFQAR